MAEAAADIKEPKKVQLSSLKRPGRPRKYAGGWLSVKNHLVKQIKLQTTVYIRWCRLKGVKQHSEFATILLDLYDEYYHYSTGTYRGVQEAVIEPVEVTCSSTMQPRSSIGHKLSKRKKTVVPLQVECYEDTQNTDTTRYVHTQKKKHGAQQISTYTTPHKKSKRNPSRLSKRSASFKKAHFDEKVEYSDELKYMNYSTMSPILKSSEEHIDDEIPIELSHETTETSNETFGQNAQEGKEEDVLLLLASDILSDTKNISVQSQSKLNTPVTKVKDQELTEVSNIDSSPVMDLGYDQDISKERSLSLDGGTLPNVEISSMTMDSYITAAHTTQTEVDQSINVLQGSVSSEKITDKVPLIFPVISSTQTDDMESMSDIPFNSLADSVHSPIGSVFVTSPTTMQQNLIPMPIQTKEKVDTEKLNISTINDTATSSHDLKSSELAVAKIISSLSDSLKKGSTNSSSSIGEGLHEKDHGKTKDGGQSITSSCPNCLYHQNKSTKRILKVVKVRHMATQFTTQILNIKRYRTVSTQTVFRLSAMSVQTETEQHLFRRSIETQYWPSPLWTKFLLRHPEVIYNIDLGDQSEFPERFKLYRKGGKLFSTLFGPNLEIQKKPSMRCISVAEFGGPEVLRLMCNIPTPKPTAKQVLVNVKAAGINPVDTYIRSGTHSMCPKLPYTPGKDGAGIVQQVGEEVTKVKKGDRVWFFGSQTGSYAEYSIVHEDFIGQLPKAIAFEEGAMVGIPYLTAFRALFQKGKVQRGETVFIHGATGGVGTAAVQICKSCGVRVIGTAGSNDGIELLKSMGVETVYNHREKGYLDEIKINEKKIDVILEMLANVNLDHDLDIVSRTNGRVVIIGSRGPVEINPRTIMATEATVTGVMLFKSSAAERLEQLHYINEGLKTGWVKPVLWKVLELENAKDAHREIIENTGARGQFVLKINATFNAPEYVPMDL